MVRTARRPGPALPERPVPPERWTADQALTELYAAHWRPLVRLAWLLLHDQQRAEEVVQDAFVSVHRKWNHLADPDRALAYLRTSVVNGSRSSLRHRVVERRWAAAGGPTAAGTSAGTSAGRGGWYEQLVPSAEDVVVRHTERLAVQEVLRALPTRQREVLVLRYWLELSESEIAQTLGISRGAVKSHAHRGLAALRVAVPGIPGQRPLRGHPESGDRGADEGGAP